MTLPDERFRSVLQTEEFLRALANPKLTPGVPRAIRKRALGCLRHYPSFYNLKEIEEAAPHIMEEHMEPLYKMVKSYNQEKTGTTNTDNN
jgi:hypothetical protein